jgi:hypothetical protein
MTPLNEDDSKTDNGIIDNLIISVARQPQFVKYAISIPSGKKQNRPERFRKGPFGDTFLIS